MNDESKLVFTDSGEGHTLIKTQWIPEIICIVGFMITFHSRWRNWQLRVQLYWLWSETPPTFPFFADLLVFTVILIALGIITGKAIGKNKIYIYDDLIKGYGFKTWAFLPRVHHFEIRYDEILSVKKYRYSIYIRSTTGRYLVIVNSPDAAHMTISQICGARS